MPSKHLKLKCVKMDLSPDPNTHPVSPMLAIIHSISFKPTGNLVAPPSKCIQHLTTAFSPPGPPLAGEPSPGGWGGGSPDRKSVV